MSVDPTAAEHPQPAESHKITHIGPRRRRLLYLVIASVIIAGLLLAGWLPRRQRSEEVDTRANEQKSALPVVQVMTVHKASAVEQLTLPGTVTPETVVHIYARCGLSEEALR